MAGFDQPNVLNPILSDVPAINEALVALAKMDPSTLSALAAQMKRIAEGADGYEIQMFNGQSWSSVGKLNHDVASVDGFSAAQTAQANAIAVRDKDGNLPGNILGNAATATSAESLSQTLPIDKGGTGGTTAEEARNLLDVAKTNHASTSTDYGLGTETEFGHVQSHDEPDAALTAAGGHALSPAGGAALNSTLRALIAQEVGDAESTASSQVSSLDTTLRALIAQEAAKCLKLSGGEMVGALTLSQFTFMNGLASSYIFAQADDVWANGSRIQLNPGHAGGSLDLLAAKDGVGTGLYLRPGDGAYVDSNKIITAAGGTLTESIKKAAGSILSCTSDASYLTINGGIDHGHGSRIVLSGKDFQEWNGELQLEASNGAKATVFRLFPDGACYVNGNSVITLVASWRSGNNWYRKYSDGWIEQGGYFADEDAWDTETVSLHTPFATADYTVLCQHQHDITLNNYEQNVLVRARTTTSFTVESFPQGIFWYACGF